MTVAVKMTRHKSMIERPQSVPGFAIRKFRELRGYTGRDFANLAGISQSHVSELESGRRRLTPAMVTRIAAAIGMAEDAFVSAIRELSAGSAGGADLPEVDLSVGAPTQPDSKVVPAVDEFRDLAEWVVARVGHDKVWGMVRVLTEEAEDGGMGAKDAARRARCLLEILSTVQVSQD